MQDEHAIMASEGLFQSLLNTEKEFLERLTVHYAIRHQPHTVPVENANDQIETNDIGPYFHDMYKLSGTYIQGGEGKTLYALENKQKSDVQLHIIMPEIELALLRARQNYNDGTGFSGVSDYIKRPDGRLFIIGAAVMAPAAIIKGDNAKPEQSQPPILVLTKELDKAFIDNLASRFALPEFNVIGTIPERDGVTASVELKSEGGLTAGWLVWKPELKSREFVRLSLQSIALALVLLFVLMGLILIRTFRLFRFLDRQHHENSENALKVREYEQAISVLARGNFVNESAVFEAVETIAKNTADALAIDRIAIWQFDEKEDVLRSLCRYDSRLRKFMETIELPVCDHPEFFEALFKGDEIQVRDSQKSILLEKMNPLFYSKDETVSVLAEPILRRGKVVGLISFANWQVDYPWSEEEFQFIRSNVTIVSLVLDTYARSLIEKELRRAKNKAEAANLAKSEFLANMSHE
ncbi:MAG: GAF domain-containing protein, partial [Sneathiella sp.]